MDFNKTKTFVEVVNAGSFSRAAKRLFRSNQAISLQIKILEEELGFSLFETRSKRIALTDQGQQLYDQASRSLCQIESIVENVINQSRATSGTLKVGVWAAHATDYLTTMMIEYRNTNPNVNFDISFGTDKELEDALLTNMVDIAFMVHIHDNELVASEVALSRSLVLVASKEYLNNKPAINNVEDIFNLDVIDYSPLYSSFHAWVHLNARDLSNRAKSIQPVVTVKSDLMLKELVTNHVGVAVIPDTLVRKEMEQGTVVPVLPQQKSGLEIPILCAYKKNRPLTTIQRGFLDKIREISLAS